MGDYKETYHLSVVKEYENGHTTSSAVTSNAEDLPTLLNDIVCFLHAAGYTFVEDVVVTKGNGEVSSNEFWDKMLGELDDFFISNDNNITFQDLTKEIDKATKELTEKNKSSQQLIDNIFNNRKPKGKK